MGEPNSERSLRRGIANGDETKTILEKLDWSNVPPYVEAIYLNGSTADTDSTQGVRDLDVIVVVNPGSLPAGVTSRLTRYGNIVRMNERQEGWVPHLFRQPVDVAFVPMSEFSSVEGLLATHRAFAASSTLRRWSLLYDRLGAFRQLADEFERAFCRRDWVVKRIAYTRSLANTKLAEFALYDVGLSNDNQIALRALRDGPVFGMYSVGTIMLTAACRRPTFRYHLADVRRVVPADVFQNTVIEAWDPHGRATWTKLESGYRLLESLFEAFRIAGTRSAPQARKPEYWLEALRQLLQGTQPIDALAPMVYLMAMLGTVAERLQLRPPLTGSITSWLAEFLPVSVEAVGKFVQHISDILVRAELIANES